MKSHTNSLRLLAVVLISAFAALSLTAQKGNPDLRKARQKAKVQKAAKPQRQGAVRRANDSTLILKTDTVYANGDAGKAA